MEAYTFAAGPEAAVSCPPCVSEDGCSTCLAGRTGTPGCLNIDGLIGAGLCSACDVADSAEGFGGGVGRGRFLAETAGPVSATCSSASSVAWCEERRAGNDGVSALS